MIKLDASKQILLIILGGLLIVRFAMVPLFAWQAETIDNIHSQQARLDKSAALIDRLSDVDALVAERKDLLSSLEGRYYQQSGNLDHLKLTLQQHIDELSSRYHLQLVSFNWLVDLSGDINESRARLTVSGKTLDVAQFQIALAESGKQIQLNEMSIELRKGATSTLGTAAANFVLSFFSVPNEGSVTAAEQRGSDK